MEGFHIGDVYEKNGQKIIDINPLPSCHCSFDCVFCPLGRTMLKTDKRFYFEETGDFINKLAKVLDENEIDLVFLNPDGESLANIEIMDIIKLIKGSKVKVRLLTNGYILNDNEYRDILEMCDEVVGELAVTNESDFQKLQRPLKGYTLDKYVENMAEFKKWFKGKFILDITILKKYSDSDESVEIFKQVINKIAPSEVFFETPSREKFKEAFGVSWERLRAIEELCSV